MSTIREQTIAVGTMTEAAADQKLRRGTKIQVKRASCQVAPSKAEGIRKGLLHHGHCSTSRPAAWAFVGRKDGASASTRKSLDFGWFKVSLFWLAVDGSFITCALACNILKDGAGTALEHKRQPAPHS